MVLNPIKTVESIIRQGSVLMLQNNQTPNIKYALSVFSLHVLSLSLFTFLGFFFFVFHSCCRNLGSRNKFETINLFFRCYQTVVDMNSH